MEHFSSAVAFFCGSRALFTRPASMDFSKINFKTKSHDTIHTFKNYFATIFSIFSFQFSIFSNKRYPNIPLMFDKFPCFIFLICWLVFSHNNNNNAFSKLWMTNGLGPIRVFVGIITGLESLGPTEGSQRC